MVGHLLVQPVSQHLVPLFVQVPFLGRSIKLVFHVLDLRNEPPVVGLQVLSLLEPLAATILSVSPILKRPSLLLQSQHLHSTLRIIIVHLS